MKATEYLILRRALCTRCGGVGIVQHPGWARYHDWRQAAKARNGGQPPSAAEVGLVLADIFEGQDPEKIPEEVPCPDCDGRGMISEYVPLVDALRELGVVG